MTTHEYEIKCRNDIISIPDVATGLRFVRSWGCSIKGLKMKDQIIKVLLSIWDEKYKDGGKHTTEVSFTNDITVTNTENRQTLLQKYDEILSFYHMLNDCLKNDINSVFQNFNDEHEYRRKELLSPDCYILVAGDRVSGKSSFINLILGKEILPTQQLACTATICEIRHSIGSETKKAYLHNKDGSKPCELNLQEDERNSFKMLKEYIKELNEDNESPYDKIEILWPFEILKNGTIFVDTPGIGENRMIVHRLQEYIKHAFGLIYVIDSAQAAGLQRGRLQDFLKSVVTASYNTLDQGATLFACNKWDIVPQKEQNKIRNLTMIKLKRIFPDIKDEQVFTVSTLQAAKSAQFGSTLPEFKVLLDNGIKKLIPTSMQNKIFSHYSWLRLILRRVCYSLKVAQTYGNQWVKENSDMIEKLKVQLTILQNDADGILESARTVVEEQIDFLHKEIADLVRSRGTRDNICTWKLEECPKQDDYKNTAQKASQKIAERIVQEIEQWDKNHHFVLGLQRTIIRKFEQGCQLMENQIQDIAGILQISSHVQPSDLRHSISVQLLWASKGENNSSNSVSGLGAAVSSAGRLSTSDKKVKELFKRYQTGKDLQEKMMQASVYYIESMFVGHRLRDSLSKFLKFFIKGIDSVAEKIPAFIRADSELIWKTELDLNESKLALKTLYPALYRKAIELQGQLDMFYVTKCMKYEYLLSDISWSNNDFLGAGSFADVYRAKLKIGKDHVSVAVKITNDKNSVEESTVTDILREDNTLRRLQHENIVKYYGSVLFEIETNEKKKNRKRLKWMMILEYCYDSLRNKVLSPAYIKPCSATIEMQASSIKTMVHYVVQICSGLQHLHDMKLVHRDLKLENVLLTRKNEKDVVKLTDVGFTISEDAISGTFVGSPVYMAPEVILRRGKYDRKADIYSLAIILWEIWYGKDAAIHVAEVLEKEQTSLEKAIEAKKVRPSLKLARPPSMEIADIIAKCWSDDPKERHNANDVGSFFHAFI